MMHDLKLGMKLLRYTYGIKSNMMLLIFCIAADTLCFFLELGGITTGLDGYYLLILVAVPVQLLFSLNLTDIVLSSPARKRLQTSVPAIMTWYAMMIAYLIITLKKMLVALIHPYKLSQIRTQLLMLAFMAALTMIFTGILYKSFPVFILMCFLFPMLIIFQIRDIFRWNILGQGISSMVWAALIGFVMITAGAAAEYGFSLLLYKRPVTKRSMGVKIMKEL